MEINKIYQGDCRNLLKHLNNESVDCVVTSPPYWSLRDYDVPLTTWDEDPSCKHEWVKHKLSLEHENRNFCVGSQEKVRGEKGTTHIAKYDDREGGFCQKCGAWLGCLGLENDFFSYIKHLCYIFDLVKKKLKKSGSLWVNIADTYSAGGRSGSREYSKKHTQFGKTYPQGKYQAPKKVEGLPSKCLCLVPERFAIGMVNRGWILRNVIIWQKSDGMPESVKDRFTRNFEYIYFFVKNRKYYFDQQFEKSTTKFIWSRNSAKGGVQKKNNPRSNWGLTKKEYDSKYSGQKSNARFKNVQTKKERDKSRIEAIEMFPNDKKKQQEYINFVHDHGHTGSYGRNKRCVWKIKTANNPEAHFATMPPELAEIMIKAGCPKNGIVLDPFAGIGTTCYTAWNLGRNFVGFELSEKYCKIAEKTLKTKRDPFKKSENVLIEKKTDFSEWL